MLGMARSLLSCNNQGVRYAPSGWRIPCSLPYMPKRHARSHTWNFDISLLVLWRRRNVTRRRAKRWRACGSRNPDLEKNRSRLLERTARSVR